MDKIQANQLIQKMGIGDQEDLHDIFMYLAEMFNYNIVDKDTGKVVNYYLCSDYKIFEK
jgi:hypothetical protein